MRHLGSFLSSRSFLLALLLMLDASCAFAQTGTIPARITQAIDENNLVTLQGNVHTLARAEFDQGPVADAQPLKRILLLLQRSPDQEAALQKLLDDQQSKSSPNYHAWLTPAQFGQQFGPADADVQTVTQWLASNGFTEIRLGPGRTVMEFSGTVGQIRNAFHTEIHQYLIEGKRYTANASDPQIPAALTPVVAGIVSLHSFRPIPHILSVGSFFRSKATGRVTALGQERAFFTGGSSFYPLAPADFATIYNTAPLINGTPKIDGTGQTIAIIGESDINVQDVANFRTLFGLPQNFTSANVFVNGVDPGFNPNETESDLDVQWAGAIAPGATIDFVTSQPTETTSGVHLSAIYAVDNNLAGVISESFGQCEQQLGVAGNQFYNSLWEQAAAQGTTVILSAGDGGSAGCDNFNTQQTAQLGLAVNGFASTPFNIAVGGTDFDQFNSWTLYWNPTNDPVTQASAKGYIPEIPWNDSCAQFAITGCGVSAPQGSLNIVAASGGPSTIYSKPSWQSGTGVPNDGKRDLPDVSLFASNGFNGSVYIVCQADVVNPPNPTCNLNSLGFSYQGIGGTSASAPAFAGIMALVNQKQSSPANPAARQGLANYVLYALAKKSGASCPSAVGEPSTCIFNDITHGNSNLPTGMAGVGTNSVPCQGGTSNCSVTTAGTNGVLVTPTSATTEAWTVGTGYDMATGLGSVNGLNLVNNWSSVGLSSTTSLTASVNGTGVSSISGTHGTPVSLSSNVAAGPGATGTPTGQVALIASPNPTKGTSSGSLGIEALSLVNGSASGSVVLPGGTYNLTAHYQGDGTFGSSDSSPSIPVSITAETSKTLISIPVFNSSTGQETGNAPTSIVYASPYLARFDVGNTSAALTFPPQSPCTPPNCPTGTVTVTDALNGGAPVPLNAGSFPLNSSGFAEDQVVQLTGGTHVLSASYSGDNSFGPSSNTYALTVTPAPTTTGPGNPPLPPTIVTPFGLGAIVTSQNFGGVMEICNVTFLDGNTPVPGTVTCGGQNGGPTYGAFIQPSLIVNQTTAGTHTYTSKFNGDANYAPSTSAPMTTRVYYGTTATITASSTNIQYGSSITLTAIIDSMVAKGGAPISDLVTFYAGYPPTNPLTGTVSYAPITDSSGNIALQATITVTPQNSGIFTATFAGDSNYFTGGTITPVNVTVNIPDFSLSANLPNPSITAGNSANATITVTPTSNSASPVMLVCPPLNLLGQAQPQGISCSFSPSTVNLSNGNPQVSTLTISTLAPSSTNSTGFTPLQPPPLNLPPRFLWPLALTSIITLLIVLLLPSRLRRNRFATVSAGTCSLTLILGFLGCGGGSSIGGGGGGGGPVPTSITLTTPNVKVPINPVTGVTVSLTANVTSTEPLGGNVTFQVDASNGFSVSSPIENGVAQYQLTGLSVGVHTISAQYSGDANNLGSQTKGSLNIAITGQTGLTIQANTGGLNHSVAINFNLQ